MKKYKTATEEQKTAGEVYLQSQITALSKSYGKQEAFIKDHGKRLEVLEKTDDVLKILAYNAAILGVLTVGGWGIRSCKNSVKEPVASIKDNVIRNGQYIYTRSSIDPFNYNYEWVLDKNSERSSGPCEQCGKFYNNLNTHERQCDYPNYKIPLVYTNSYSKLATNWVEFTPLPSTDNHILCKSCANGEGVELTLALRLGRGYSSGAYTATNVVEKKPMVIWNNSQSYEGVDAR